MLLNLIYGADHLTTAPQASLTQHAKVVPQSRTYEEYSGYSYREKLEHVLSPFVNDPGNGMFRAEYDQTERRLTEQAIEAIKGFLRAHANSPDFGNLFQDEAYLSSVKAIYGDLLTLKAVITAKELYRQRSSTLSFQEQFITSQTTRDAWETAQAYEQRVNTAAYISFKVMEWELQEPAMPKKKQEKIDHLIACVDRYNYSLLNWKNGKKPREAELGTGIGDGEIGAQIEKMQRKLELAEEAMKLGNQLSRYAGMLGNGRSYITETGITRPEGMSESETITYAFNDMLCTSQKDRYGSHDSPIMQAIRDLNTNIEKLVTHQNGQLKTSIEALLKNLLLLGQG